MKRILIILTLFITTVQFAQEYKFGKVSKQELEEKYYPLDSTANAAYLYKYRKTYYTYNQNTYFQVVTEVHERIKIYNKKGFDKATKSIIYYRPTSGENEKISSIRGFSFNIENGKINKQKISKSSIFDEKISEYRSVKKITFPNIKEGVVIDLKYTLTSPYYTIIDDVEFQFDIPVKSLECTIEVPEFYTFNKKTKGYYSIFPKTSFRDGNISISQRVRSVTRGGMGVATNSQVRTSKINLKYNTDFYKAKNIPALKDDEPFVSNVNNYRGGVKFELVQTNFLTVGGEIKYYSKNWEDVSKQIYKSSNFGSELNRSGYYKDELQTILANTTTDFEKVGAIFNFVKKKVKWNRAYGKYIDNGVRKAFKEREGNVADINLMLTSMLRYAGLNANPVLVSTRNHGVPFFPTSNGFNYVISIVEFADGTFALLDATEPYSIPNLLPKRAINWKGRKVTKSGTSSWVNLTSSKHALEDNTIMAKIADDFTVEGLIRTKYDNLKALNFRTNNNHLKEEDLITKYEERYNIDVDNFKITNEKNLRKPINRNVKFIGEDFIEEINGKLYIEPMLFLTQHTNPFKLEDRKFPIDFITPWKDKNVVSIQLPKGYKVASLPETIAIGLPDNLGVFKYQVTQVGNNIKAISILQFDEAIIVPQYYAALKEFYGKYVEKQSEKVVLIKE